MRTTSRIERDERFTRVVEYFENYGCKGSETDFTIPGTDAIGRYAFISECEDLYSINRCMSIEAVEVLAAHEVHEGYSPICYFDLDELAGDPPIIDEGDLVLYNKPYRVNRVDEELIEGEVGRYLCLVAPEGTFEFDDFEERVHEDDVEVIEGADDERMPVRYNVAGYRTIVIFNTEASS